MGVQRQILFSPAPWGPGEGSKGQISFNFNHHMTSRSGSEITPCNKIDKPLVVYRFTGNVMMFITTLRT